MLSPVLQVLESVTSYCCLLWLLPLLFLCKCLCRHTGVGLETGPVLMNSEKLPLCFGWCCVLDSVLSSTAQTLVPAQKQREGQVALWLWLILDYALVPAPLKYILIDLSLNTKEFGN